MIQESEIIRVPRSPTNGFPEMYAAGLSGEDAFKVGMDYVFYIRGVRRYASVFSNLANKRWYFFKSSCERGSETMLRTEAARYGLKLRLTPHPSSAHDGYSVELLGPADPRFEAGDFDTEFLPPVDFSKESEQEKQLRDSAEYQTYLAYHQKYADYVPPQAVPPKP